MSDTVIKCRGLTKAFGAQTVLSNLNLEIHSGQIVAIVGANGCGKTTLMRCLLGLLRRTSGESFIFGEDSWDLSADAKNRLGYVSQEFSLLPWMTVESFCNYTSSFYPAWDHAFVFSLISQWDLPLKKRVSTLSGGQRQKLATILAIGHHPELLILDEPVASLDPIARRQFLKTLIEFSTNRKQTILFSSHITTDLERIASHVLFLSQGHQQYFGELDLLKERCKRLRIYSQSLLPESFQLPGEVRCQTSGTTALVTTTQYTEDLQSTVERRWNARVQVEDLNLEELFVEFSGMDKISCEPVEESVR
ncbi:MAG TPA: ABC transporter ATP-binding protein [Planctomicrobium sp.]|nr:ABC transporter ATP-binding protein [Planctomicrobium sp.]